ncbi:hypothetical protein WDU94_001301 [Cyamophila willieti]
MLLFLAVLANLSSNTLADSTDGDGGAKFGDLRILSREFNKQQIVHDHGTPIYGLVRTPCYPLNSTSLYTRLSQNLQRAPELFLGLLCCLACLAWICAALGISFCFGHRYRCALCLGDGGGFIKNCLHFGCCCFICHFCLNRTQKKDNCEPKVDRCQDPMRMPSRTGTMDSRSGAPTSMTYY